MGKQAEIKQKLQDRSVDGTVTCHDARELAEDLGVAYKEVGDAANELDVRITGCELGCF